MPLNLEAHIETLRQCKIISVRGEPSGPPALLARCQPGRKEATGPEAEQASLHKRAHSGRGRGSTHKHSLRHARWLCPPPPFARCR